MAVLGFGAQLTTFKPQDPADGAISVALDATLSEGDEHSVTVTDHPIEDGASASDHIRDEPDQVTFDGIVSRTPIENPVSLLLEPSQRHEDAWGQFVYWLKNHILVKVTTSINTWEDMAIQSLSRRRSSDVGEAVQMTIKVKQIVKVVSSEAEAPVRSSPHQGPTARDSIKTTTPVSDQSVAHYGLSAIFGG
jgi:hypothetical protein